MAIFAYSLTDTDMIKRLKIIALTLVLSYLVFPSVGLTQCQGPSNGGFAFVIDLTSPTPVVVNVGGFDVTFDYNTGTNEMFVQGASGVMIYSAISGEAGNVSMGTDLSSLTNYVSGPLLLYNTNSNYGPFGGGIGGYLAVQSGGQYGYIEMQLCGVKVCNTMQYTFDVTNSGLMQQGSTNPQTGICASLLAPEDIPTLSQWSLIALALLLMIFSVLVRDEKMIYSMNEKTNE